MNKRQSDWHGICYVILILKDNHIERDAMTLWLHWWNPIALLRPAFSRLRSFLWFATAVAGLTVRPDS
jgi:hypothetical protein